MGSLQPIAEPIDLSDLRAELSMDLDDQSENPFLTSAIEICRDRLESILPYYLAERDVGRVYHIPDEGRTRHEIVLKGPVLQVHEVLLRMRDGSAWAVPPECHPIVGNVMYVDISGAPEAPVAIEVSYRAGAHIPPVVRGALMRMVRMYYADRVSDPLTDEIVKMVSGERRMVVR